MSEATGGKFRSKRVQFSQVSNKALQDKNLSLKAKGLYALIQSLITIPDFTLYKTTLMNMCQEGESAFKSTWNELKKRGYLVQYKINTHKGFVYEYELLDEVKDSPEGDFPPVGNSCVGNSPSGKSTGGEPTQYNNKQENNTDLNNTKNINHSFVNNIAKELIDLRKAKIEDFDTEMDFKQKINELLNNPEILSFDERMKDNILNGSSLNNFSYNEVLVYCAKQVNIAFSYSASDYNNDDFIITYSSAFEWLLAMTNLYTTLGDVMNIGKSTYKTQDIRQRLYQLDEYTFSNMLNKFNELTKSQDIKNISAYMKMMLINASFDSGDVSFKANY